MLDCVVKEIMELKVVKTGQFCCAHDYALVHEDIHERFIKKLTAVVEGLGEQRNVMMIGRRHYESVKAKLEDAKAECIPPMQGSFVPNDEKMTLPFTGLLAPALDKAVNRTEIFGPLLPILKIKSVDEAIARIGDADRRQPLIAYCYSEDPASVDVFVKSVCAGNIAVNSGPQRFHIISMPASEALVAAAAACTCGAKMHCGSSPIVSMYVVRKMA